MMLPMMNGNRKASEDQTLNSTSIISQRLNPSLQHTIIKTNAVRSPNLMHQGYNLGEQKMLNLTQVKLPSAQPSPALSDNI
jgi:hypothetical protein